MAKFRTVATAKKNPVQTLQRIFWEIELQSRHILRKKKSEVRHIFRQIHSTKDVFEKNKIQSRHILKGKKGLNSPCLEGAKKF
jgi:hypothetical protein